MVASAKAKMTAGEFWQLPETETRFELINGDIIEMATPIPEHQDVVGDTFVLLKQISRTQGGKVYVSPLEVYLDEYNVPQPDVMWLAPDSRCVVGEKRLEGAPDLVVEVFSPSTKHLDKDSKFKLYQRHGVREYWMIDPVEQFIEIWELIEGRFSLNGVYDIKQNFNSTVLGGLTIEVQLLFGG